MSDNIYQPPQSEVDISQESHQPFYVVSKQKFWILFAATFGIYSLYWFYQHWRQYKRFTGTSIWPVPRAIFSVFFAHSLFRSIRNMADEQGYSPPISPGLLATIYVVFSLLSNGADRAAARDWQSVFRCCFILHDLGRWQRVISGAKSGQRSIQRSWRRDQ